MLGIMSTHVQLTFCHLKPVSYSYGTWSTEIIAVCPCVPLSSVRRSKAVQNIILGMQCNCVSFRSQAYFEAEDYLWIAFNRPSVCW